MLITQFIHHDSDLRKEDFIIIAVERLIVFHRPYRVYWEVCLRKVRTIFLTHLAQDLMRAVAPSWSVSNFVNVLFVSRFYVFLA